MSGCLAKRRCAYHLSNTVKTLSGYTDNNTFHRNMDHRSSEIPLSSRPETKGS